MHDAAEHSCLPQQALNICIALLERRRLLESTGGTQPGGSPKCVRTAAADAALEAEAVEGLAPYAPRLQALLTVDDSTDEQVSDCRTPNLSWTQDKL